MQFSNSKKRMLVILKIVERCNINCSYCYVFNLGNDVWMKHPKYIKPDTVEQLCDFLKQGCIDIKLDEISIEYHGGEPLMYNKTKFIELCETIKSVLSPYVKVSFAMQTNAMLLSDAWIDIICRYRIGVGVSIDGPEIYHDKYRVDHRGNGTYKRVIDGMRLLQNSKAYNKFSAIGILCVMNPEHDARLILRHFVGDLNVTNIDFILPDYNYSSLPPFTNEQLSKFLQDLLDEWLKYDDPKITVRFLSTYLNLFTNRLALSFYPSDEVTSIPAVTISSAGTLGPADQIHITMTEQELMQYDIYNIRLKSYLYGNTYMKNIVRSSALPKDCYDCYWKKVCGGGKLQNRYNSENRSYDQPTIYCSALKDFYAALAKSMVERGYPVSQLSNNLMTN